MQFDVKLDELDQFGHLFWQHIHGKKVFAFHGPMGAGKTTTISAICRAAGVADPVSSPTYAIINQYALDTNGASGKIFHIDLYRLKDDEEIIQSGVEDCIYSGDYCFVEWPEKAPWLFTENSMHVYVELLEDDKRGISLVNGEEPGNGSVGEQS